MPLGYTQAPRVTETNQASRTRRLSRSLTTGNNGTPLKITLWAAEDFNLVAAPVAGNALAQRSVTGVYSSQYATYAGVEQGFYGNAGYLVVQYMDTGVDILRVDNTGTTLGGALTVNSLVVNSSTNTNTLLVNSLATINTLTVTGGEIHALTSVNTNTTLNSTHYTVEVNASAGNVTITLPAVSGNVGRIYNIKKVDNTGYYVVIDGASAELIENNTVQYLYARGECLTIQANTTGWSVI